MGKRKFRTFLGVGILFILVCTSLNSSWAVEGKYPSRNIEIYCGFPPGGQTDLVIRGIATGLEKFLGVPVVIINKLGGGGVVSTTALANARPDGYTLAQAGAINIVSPLVLGQATYSLEDLRTVGGYGYIPNVVAVSVDSPWKTFKEFLDYEKKNPGVKYAHPGIGTGPYLRMENLIRSANLKMINVPFKGDPEVASAVLGKHIPVGVFSGWFAKVQEDGGKMKILFSFDPPVKVGLSPNIPDTLSTFGKSMADNDLKILQTLIVPQKTPDEIVGVLEQALEKVTKDPEFVNPMKKFMFVTEFVDRNTTMQLVRTIYMPGVKAILKP
jgi:tripartite-type tricarboxylate transporter receptor subunit TctC